MQPTRSTYGSKPRVRAIRVFVLMFAAAIAIDTFPDAWSTRFALRSRVQSVLAILGLAQGDWPLFAPNPGMFHGYVVGDAIDGQGNTAFWTSPEWPKASAWQKFVDFRHMNYYHRVIGTKEGASDFADYLLRSIPDRESVQPGFRWTEDEGILRSEPIVPPVREITLYHREERINISYEELPPDPSEIVTSLTNTFLVKREQSP